VSLVHACRGLVAAAACLLAAAPAACGKKGPPLAPIVHVPDAVRQLAARRVGDEVVLTLAMPVQNVDGSTPVDLARVDVFGYTGRTAPPLVRFTDVASVVETITGTAAPSAATVRDTLTPDELVAGPPLVRPGGSGTTPAAPTAVQARAPLRRYYVAIAFDDRGRAGPPSAIVDLPLTPIPDPPLVVEAVYSADTATVTWQPSGGLVGFLLDLAPPPTATPLDDEALPEDAGALPAGPTRYHVYREFEPDAPASAAAGPTAAAAPPEPASGSPIDGFLYSEPLQVDGRRRCYRVAAVRGSAARAVEGRRSAPACITPVDTFPPSPPTGLSPIAVDGAISLVWEANAESDLGGYLVWRGEDGVDGMTRMTAEPLTETRYTDEGVRSGVRYVYVVTAVDTARPEPNASEPSTRVEITAR
jgi:hypothetical protein